MTGVKCLDCDNGRMVIAEQKNVNNKSRKTMVVLRCDTCGKREVF